MQHFTRLLLLRLGLITFEDNKNNNKLWFCLSGMACQGDSILSKSVLCWLMDGFLDTAIRARLWGAGCAGGWVIKIKKLVE